LQRHDFPEVQIRALKEAYKTIYKSDLNVAEAISKLKEANAAEEADHPVNELVAFVESSQRGIIR